jgi:hypothetical protein
MSFQIKCETFEAFFVLLHLKLTHVIDCVDDAPPSSLMDSTTSPKVKTMEGEGFGAHSLAHSTLGVKGCVRTSGWDYEYWQAI